ncbi:NADH:ubiquinone reductase (Na(+)-transporting) subunit C [Prolixibacteraceae bacterium JC049]|nr:NADH:ubiquinone reductase (Na(+)-transporting) subunit C [Prolixibacteraceae bacterium JC049]
MDRNGNTYTFLYAAVMVIVVAALLAATAVSLKPFQKRNIEIEKMQNILASVNIQADVQNASKIYKEKITTTYVVDAKGNKKEGVNAFTVNLKKERSLPVAERSLPVYEANVDGKVKYIIPLRGAGLWGPIWGYISLDEDMNTIFGANFDHQGETPGLGAEISTTAFEAPFIGKKIFNAEGKLVSITVAKKGEKAEPAHSVDAISGGTITSKGLEQMISDDLNSYKEFFNKKK